MALTQKKIEKGLKLFESLGIFSIIFSFQEKELVLVALSQEFRKKLCFTLNYRMLLAFLVLQHVLTVTGIILKRYLGE